MNQFCARTGNGLSGIMSHLPRTLWILLLLGAVLRVAAIELRPEGALFTAPDEPEYLAIAESIAAGNGFAFYGEPTAYRDMLFPSLAGGLMAMVGSECVVFYLQLLLDLGTALLLFLIVRRHRSESAALMAGAFWLLYPAAVLFTALFLTETLFVFLWVLALYVYDRIDPDNAARVSLILGLILGLLLLTRATGVILVLALVLHLLFRRHYRTATVMLVVMLVVILPWMMRNASVMGSFSLNTNSGINLYQGNNPYATGAYRFDDPVTAPLEFGKLKEAGRNQRATRLSLEYIRSFPVQTLALWPRKLAYFWSTDVSLWAHYAARPGVSLAARLRALPWTSLAVTAAVYIALVMTGVAGLGLSTTAPLRGVLIAQIGLATLSAFATYGLARYHYPLMPALIIGAASLQQPGMWRSASAARRVITALILLFLVAVWGAEMFTIAMAES